MSTDSSLDEGSECSDIDNVRNSDNLTFNDIVNATFSELDADEDPEFDDFEESFEEPDEKKKLNLTEELLLFMMLFNISKRVMTHLLIVLNAHGVAVPRSVYLLKLTCNMNSFKFVTDLRNASIAYCSVMENIKYCIEKGFLNLKRCVNLLTIHVNVDGLPLFKSSNLNLWPILMTIKESSYPKPLPIAMYCGLGKPKLIDFLSKLVSEVEKLKTDITEICGFPVLVKDVVFICDAPARSFLQCICGHSAALGCSYCRIVGRKEFGMVFSYTGYENLSAITRDDQMYKDCKENNQYFLSPLTRICLLRNSFPPEFMHSVCLGVMRKLCEFYFLGAKRQKLPCKMSVSLKENVSEQICNLSKHLPSEFSRKLRTLNEFSHYKAVEFRMLLLYLGPIIFKNVLPLEYYSHFLLLHYSMYCFCSPDFSNTFFAEAEGCIERFCETSETLFHNRLQTYNTHVIRHIPEFVRLYGVLDSWSAFIYENYLGLLKRRLRCTSGMFKQTINNLNIMNHLFARENIHEFSYSSHPPNNCCISNGRIFLITSVVENVVSGIELLYTRPLYEYPYSSENLRIGFYRKTCKTRINVLPDCKCIIVPYPSDIFLVMPLVNSECFVN